MALFKLYILEVFISLTPEMCHDFSYYFTDLRESIMHNKKLVTVILTLMATVFTTKVAFAFSEKKNSHCKSNYKRIRWAGLYIGITTIVTYFNVNASMLANPERFVIQLVIGIFFLGLLFFSISHKKEAVKVIKKQELSANPTTIPSPYYNNLQPDNLIPTVEHITKSIRFVDDLFLYKKSFEHMLGKFYEWTILFSEQRQPKNFEPPQPTYTTLDALTLQLKASLIEKRGRLPRLLIEKIACPTQTLSRQIVCDVNQMIHLLVAAVLRIAGVDNLEKDFVKLQLCVTYLQVDKGAAIDKQDTCLTMYRAIAMVLSNAGTPSDEIPKVKSCYKHVAGSSIERIKQSKAVPHYVDSYKETIESIIDSNYGYLEYPRNHKNAMLLVLPANIASIDKQMVTCTSNNDAKPEKAITLKEETDCMIILMQFCDFICRSFKKIKAETISKTLLLLKRGFGTKQHASGELFYIRAVEITKIIAQWIVQASEPIYGCLLYDLVRHTGLSLGYIKDNYNPTVQNLVQRVLDIDTHQKMELSLPKVKTHYKKAVDRDDPGFFVLYIKLAERLYDLRHAENYTCLEEVKYMAKETLELDVKLAEKYVDLDTAEALEIAAKHAEAYLIRQGH